jgi:hypothetical protein
MFIFHPVMFSFIPIMFLFETVVLFFITVLSRIYKLFCIFVVVIPDRRKFQQPGSERYR